MTPKAVFALTYEAHPAAASQSQLFLFFEIVKCSFLFKGLFLFVLT